MFAISGYLHNFEHQLLGYLADFKEVNSMFKAYCMALTEAIQCAIEEFECIEADLQISSNEVVNWLTKENSINWECKFVVNKLKSIKRWFKNISVAEANNVEFCHFSLWKDKCNQSYDRQVAKISRGVLQ